MIPNRILAASLLLWIFTLANRAGPPVEPGNSSNSHSACQQTNTKFGALAIDHHNGYYFGWASDCNTLEEAQKKALAESKRKGGEDCIVVLSYSGTGCAAYRYSSGKIVGLAIGWGLASTKEEADIIAKSEHFIRSYGMQAPNVSYSCNSPDTGPLKMIYNATNELSTLPGEEEDY